MESFEPHRLKQLRQQRSVSVQEMATRLNLSVQQIHRLEKGERRLTVDMLMQYCDELDFNVHDLFSMPSQVPVTGIINEEYEVLAPPPDSQHSVSVPALIPNARDLAALRWQASGNISRISGHLAFYYVHQEGIPENAWENRCLIVMEGGTQCVGWLIEQDGITHVDNPDGRTRFNVDVTWASPIIAVVPPWVLST